MVSALRDVQPHTNDDERWRLNDEPQEDDHNEWRARSMGPSGGSSCASGCLGGHDRRTSFGEWDITNADEMKMAVAICEMTERPVVRLSSTSNLIRDLGPVIEFQWRTEDNETIHTPFSADIPDENEGTYLLWPWIGASGTGLNNLDWSIGIRHAQLFDHYDMRFIKEDRGW